MDFKVTPGALDDLHALRASDRASLLESIRSELPESVATDTVLKSSVIAEDVRAHRADDFVVLYRAVDTNDDGAHDLVVVLSVVDRKELPMGASAIDRGKASELLAPPLLDQIASI